MVCTRHTGWAAGCVLLGFCAACYGGETGKALSQTIEHLEVIAEGRDPEEMASALRRVDGLLAKLAPQDRAVLAAVTPPGKRRLRSAWRIGRTLCYRAANDATLHRIDLDTAKPLTPLTLDELKGANAVWAGSSGRPDEMIAFCPKRAVVLNVRTGRKRLTISDRIDPRIAPVLAGEDLVFVRGGRGRTLVRVNRKGEDVWTCGLPGYVMCHPAAHGPILVAQTRGGSYGGQATSCVDLGTGKRLWSKTTNAYGLGAVFGPHGEFVVEANLWLSPGGTEARIVARNPQTGEPLWEYRRPGMIHHRPVVHRAKGLVLAAVEPGVVVCLRAKDGSVVWETPLPAAVVEAPASSYDPYWPALALDGNRLIVLDCESQLHVLDVDRGSKAASVAARSPVTPDGKSRSYDTPVNLPWIKGDQLVVASRQSGVVVYPTRHLLAGRESPELRARAVRVKLLLRLGRVKDAADEVARMQAMRSCSGATLEALAELCRFRNDRDGEVLARLRMMRSRGRTTDPRLLILVGLVRSAFCGPRPTNLPRIGGHLYVGSADGRLRRFRTEDLAPAGELDVKVAIGPHLAVFDNALVFPTANRHVQGASRDLRRLFDWSAPNPASRYVVVNGRLIRSSGYVGFVKVAVLDLERKGFCARHRIDCQYNTPVVHRGRVYYPTGGGGSRSFDGDRVETHPAKLKVANYRVNARGDRPVAFGTGGVYEVDEHLRPVKRIVELPGRAAGAVIHRGTTVALCERRDGSGRRTLNAWDRAGAKLPLQCGPRRAYGHLDRAPALLPFGDGVLVVGRELTYVDPSRKDAVWQFWPGASQKGRLAMFRGPLVVGNKVYVTHTDGYLSEFSKLRILQNRLPADAAPE